MIYQAQWRRVRWSTKFIEGAWKIINQDRHFIFWLENGKKMVGASKSTFLFCFVLYFLLLSQVQGNFYLLFFKSRKPRMMLLYECIIPQSCNIVCDATLLNLIDLLDFSFGTIWSLYIILHVTSSVKIYRRMSSKW